MDLLEAIRLLPATTKINLLSKVSLRDMRDGAKKWLLLGSDFSMPIAMFFTAHEMGIINDYYFTARMNMFRPSVSDIRKEMILFLPEFLERKFRIPNEYDVFCSPQCLRAIKILRLKAHSPTDAEPLTTQNFPIIAMYYRRQAILYADDAAWLAEVANDPEVAPDDDFFDQAARMPAVKCFRYLLLLGFEPAQTTLQMAVCGGNEEIITTCIECGCDLTDKFLMNCAATSGQARIVQWLMSSHGHELSVHEFVSGFNNYHWFSFFAAYPILYTAVDVDQLRMLHSNDKTHLSKLVRMILSDKKIPAATKKAIRENQNLIVNCDDVELARDCNLALNDGTVLQLIINGNNQNLMNVLKDAKKKQR